MTVVNERLESFETASSRSSDVHELSVEFVRDRKGHEYTVRRVHVEDESDENPELRAMYAKAGEDAEIALRDHDEWEKTEIITGNPGEPSLVHIPENNPPARWLYHDIDDQPTQMVEWASQFPSASALEPLQRLKKGGRWLSKGTLDDRTLEFFTYMVDGIGIRSRARIYSQRLVEYAQESDVSELSVISLGSGAAVPNILATQKLEAEGKSVDWKFFDFDPLALKRAEELITENNFKSSTFDYGPQTYNEQTQEFEWKGQSYLQAFREKDESADIVDALGLWEYLKPHHAVRFAEALYKKVKPGGSMIVSNMLPSRPQREFNERAVGWPNLYLRNETDLLDIVTEAGIDSRQVTMTHAEDGVYVVMEIKKPHA